MISPTAAGHLLLGLPLAIAGFTWILIRRIKKSRDVG